jgi:membrane-bound lytic murein transglycosylase MltF
MKEKGMIPEDFDAFNPEDSKMAQRAYMESLLDRSWNKGSEEVKIAKALAAYNFGPTAVVRTLNQAREDGVDIYNSLDWLERLPLETRDYVSKILGYNEKFESEYYDSPLRSGN